MWYDICDMTLRWHDVSYRRYHWHVSYRRYVVSLTFIAAVVSLTSHRSCCIIDISSQLSYHWHVIAAVVSLTCHRSCRIIDMSSQLSYHGHVVAPTCRIVDMSSQHYRIGWKVSFHFYWYLFSYLWVSSHIYRSLLIFKGLFWYLCASLEGFFSDV